MRHEVLMEPFGKNTEVPSGAATAAGRHRPSAVAGQHGRGRALHGSGRVADLDADRGDGGAVHVRQGWCAHESR